MAVGEEKSAFWDFAFSPSVAEAGSLGMAAARSFPGTGNNPLASNQNITTLKSISTSLFRYPTQTSLESKLPQAMLKL
jgi:hypothetical protein